MAKRVATQLQQRSITWKCIFKIHIIRRGPCMAFLYCIQLTSQTNHSSILPHANSPAELMTKRVATQLLQRSIILKWISRFMLYEGFYIHGFPILCPTDIQTNHPSILPHANSSAEVMVKHASTQYLQYNNLVVVEKYHIEVDFNIYVIRRVHAWFSHIVSNWHPKQTI